MIAFLWAVHKGVREMSLGGGCFAALGPFEGGAEGCVHVCVCVK